MEEYGITRHKISRQKEKEGECKKLCVLTTGIKKIDKVNERLKNMYSDSRQHCFNSSNSGGTIPSSLHFGLVPADWLAHGEVGTRTQHGHFIMTDVTCIHRIFI